MIEQIGKFIKGRNVPSTTINRLLDIANKKDGLPMIKYADTKTIQQLNEALKDFVLHKLQINDKVWMDINEYMVVIENVDQPFCDQNRQIIFIPESIKNGRELVYKLSILHEMIHLSSIHFIRNNNGKVFISRFGAMFKKKSDSYFNYGVGWDEALTEEMTRQIFTESQTLFKEYDLNQEDESELFVYKEHREVLYLIARAIMASGKFDDLKQALLFLFSMKYSTDLKEYAALIDKYMGRGAFKLIMRMKADGQSAKKTLQKLQALHASIN